MRKAAFIPALLLLMLATRARADDEWCQGSDCTLLAATLVVGGTVATGAVIGVEYIQFRPVLQALSGDEPTRAALGWSFATSAVLLGGLEYVSMRNVPDFTTGKALAMAAMFAPLMIWDAWKLTHPIAVAPVVTKETKALTLATRF